MGGSNNPDNIINLTPYEHSLAHKKLYEKYKKVEDYIAWKGLSKRINKEQIIRLKCSLGGKKSTGHSKGGRSCKGVKKNYKITKEELQLIQSIKGKKSTNKNYKHWTNDVDYKFCKEQPKGYSYIKPRFQYLAAESVKKTYWWNNGIIQKRSKKCPGLYFVKGRINSGNLGGDRKSINNRKGAYFG